MSITQQLQSLYLHFPHCLHLCNYCDFFKSVAPDMNQALNSFQENLQLQWRHHQHWTQTQGYALAPLKTLYFGGGTPSLWGEQGANWFKENLSSLLDFEDDYEWTMEVNPKAWTPVGLAAWEQLGLNRYSVGVQSFNEHYLKILDRFHNLQDVTDLLHHLKGKNFSVDLMLGLPEIEDHKRDLKAEIDSLIEYGPSHFSVYILTVKSNYKHFKKLPSDEQVENEYLFVSDYLKSLGFHHYEVSNFALPGRESKHNLRYWHGESVMALGPSAVGYLNETRTRYKWKAHTNDFEIEELTNDEVQLEYHYLRLRLSSGLDLAHLKLNASQISALAELKKNWQQQGWLASNPSEPKIRLSAKGLLMMDSVTGALMDLNLF